MAEACRALESRSSAATSASTTRAAGTTSTPPRWSAVLGVIDDLTASRRVLELADGTCLFSGTTDPSLAGSRWAVVLRGHPGGTLPALDLATHRRSWVWWPPW